MSLPPAVVWMLLAVFLGGCAGLPTDYPRQRSEAIHTTDDTRIGREVAPLLVVHPGKSGVFTLGNGLDAFVARLALAEAGVEIDEMRPEKTADEVGRRRFGQLHASLHVKTIVFDRERVLVGSMNLDPRSGLLHTEMAILIDSPELAGAIGDGRDQNLADIAWRVDLEQVASPHSPAGEETRLVWISHEEGRESRR